MTQKNRNISGILWTALTLSGLALLFSRVVYPEILWLSALLGAVLLCFMGVLIRENQAALRSRTAAYGLNSAITVILVIGIVGVLNFLGSRYPLKADLTKNRVHTLSDQTIKLIRGLTKPVKATFYAKIQQREQIRPLLENYKALNIRFEVEYVDPDREPTRVKQFGIKKYGTLQLQVGTRDTKIEEPTEEKITNSLIKILKDKTPTLCALTGHGERSMSGTEGEGAEGYGAIRKALLSQSYETKDINLIEEKGKVPEACDALMIAGPTKSFFEPEIKAISAYLDNGGRALIAYDVNIKGGDFAPELAPVLQTWNVKPIWSVIVDPLSRMLGVDASVPIVASYSKEHPITKDFQPNTFFAFARPFEILSNSNGGNLKTEWLAQTTPKSWGVADAKALSSGEVAYREGKDKMGPLTVAVSVSGKKNPQAPRDTRLVIFGSSGFATNNYSRFGGNLDLFLNSASWLMEDESLISIRAKEEGSGRIELSQKVGSAIFLVTVILVPFLTGLAGIVIWVRRRKL